MNEEILMTLVAEVSFEESLANASLDIVSQTDVEVFANEILLNDIDETERFTLISSYPEMPAISVVNNMYLQIRGRLKVEYTKVSAGNIIRKWLNYYPEESDYVEVETIEPGATWNINFGDDIRGGTATFEYVEGVDEWSDENIKTFTFYIRGVNPTRDEVVAYIEDNRYDEKYWFLIRLIRHESATGDSDEFRQFNVGSQYTVMSLKGLPNWGGPRGYGLGQIDNLGRLNIAQRNALNLDQLEIGETMVDEEGRTIDWEGYIVASDNQVWNWQENINSTISFLDVKCTELRGFIRRMRNNINNWNNNNPGDLTNIPNDILEGGITFSWVASEIVNFEYYNDIFEEDATDTIKSFYDAILLKYYNGIGNVNAHHYMYNNALENQKPEILLERGATFIFNEAIETRHYVQSICEENE